MGQAFFRIEHQGKCIHIGFERGAELTVDQIIEVMDRENDLYEIKGRYDLWDFRGCRPSPSFGYEAMNRIVEHIKIRHGQGPWSDKTALLVDDATQYGLSRMFQILVDGFPTQIGIFMDEAEARDWLGCRLDAEG
jgi:hypothetical protein